MLIDALSPATAAGLAGPRPAAPPADGFAAVHGRAAEALKEAEAASLAAIEGRVPAHRAVGAILEAERALNTAVAIRDKLTAAYLELTRMQI